MPRADIETVKSLDSSSKKFIEMVQKKFGILLDFSEEALLVADDLFSMFFKLRRNHFFIVSGVIGAYLGNVIIKNIGGRWSKNLHVEKVGKIKTIVNPLLRAKKRLANGKQDSFVFYYRSLKLSVNQDPSFAPDKEKIENYYSVLRQRAWDKILLTRVKDPSEKKYVREEAADILGRLGSNDIVPDLIEDLKSAKTAYYSAMALQGIPDERSFDPLLKMLKKTRSPFLKMQTALALGSIGNDKAVPHLMVLLNDENEILAHYASMALARIKSPKVTDMILESGILQNTDRAIYAIFVLGEEKDDRAVPALIECLFSRDEHIKEAATGAFQNFTDERSFEPLSYLLSDKSYKIRTLAGYAIARFGKERAGSLIRPLIKDPVQSVRLHAEKLLYWLEHDQIPPQCM